MVIRSVVCAEMRQKKQTVTVIIQPVISYKDKNGEHSGYPSSRRRRSQVHINEQAVTQGQIAFGKHNKDNRFSPDGYWDAKCEEETRFNFYVFNFRSHEIAEKLLSIQPAEPF